MKTIMSKALRKQFFLKKRKIIEEQVKGVIYY